MLDLALLGLLADAPMHGYQLRARLTEVLGPVRCYSYGSLYPALRRLQRAGDLAVQEPGSGVDDAPATRPRGRVIYRTTGQGRARLAALLAEAGPASWTDEGFGVHLALFGYTTVEARLRILDGRRRHLERRREGLRACISGESTGLEDDTAQRHRLAIQSHDREILWIRGLIAREVRRRADPDMPGVAPDPGEPRTDGARPDPAASPAEIRQFPPLREVVP